MDSVTYPHASQAGAGDIGSCIPSPQIETRDSASCEFAEKTLLNNLTHAGFQPGEISSASPSSRRLQRSERQLSPEFAHLGQEICQKMLPKSLTLAIQARAAAARFAALRQSPENSHLVSRIVLGNVLRAVGRSARLACKLPKKLTSGPRKRPFRPISGVGSRKTSPSMRIFSRFFSPHVFQPLDLAEKWRQSSLPNPLTVAFSVTSKPGPAARDLPGRGLPYRLTLAGKSRIPSLPNPLTSFPAAAHQRSRSPPPICPAGAHPGSRKASPARPESPAR